MTSTTGTTRRTAKRTKLDTITASLVARQSRTNDGTMSVPDQIAAMKEWCVKHNIVVGSIYTELSTSGRKPLDKRKGLRSAVDDVVNGDSQMVLTAYFDRFVRSVRTRADVLTIVEEEHGGTVMTMDFGATSDATPASKFTGTILAAVSEFIAEQAGEKTHVTKQRNIDNGVPPFPKLTPAYVKREDGTLDLHPINAPLIAEACRMRAGIGYSAPQSWTKIARWLNEQGIVDTETGEPHEMTQVSTRVALSSKLLIGEIHFGGFTPNLRAGEKWGGVVIDRATFRKMHKAKVTRGRLSKSEQLLARQGVLVCGTCDSRMIVNSSTGQTGKVYSAYRCGNTLCDTKAIVMCDVANDAARDKAIELSAGFAGHATMERKVEAARVDAEKKQEKLNKAIRVLAVSDDEDEARDVLDELQLERDTAATKYERLKRASSPGMTVRTLDDWDRLTLDEQRGIVVATIDRIVVAPGKGDGRLTIVTRELLSE